MRPICLPIRIVPLAALALAGAASAQTSDRYGAGQVVYATPGSRFAPAVVATSPPPSVLRAPPTAPVRATRVLNWPGKTSPTVVAQTAPATAPQPVRSQAPKQTSPTDRGWIPVASEPARAPSAPARLGPPVRPWTQRYAAAPAAPTAAPSTAYASAAANPSTGAPNGGARYYSVHRAYGLTPDAAPIPPQFFGPTADLGAPEIPDALRRANPTAATVNAARLASETAQ